MTSPGQKVHVFGRLRGVTVRRLGLLVRAAGLGPTRRAAAADLVVLAHGTAKSLVSAQGELRLPFQSKGDAQFLSERSFRARIGMPSSGAAADRCYSADQVVKLAGLEAGQLRTLGLYDVVTPPETGLSYTDLIVARAVARLLGQGAAFPKIIAAALALEERGISLSGVRLAEAPWGELVQVLDGGVAQVDGQLVLSFQGSDVNSDEAFAGAEAYERAGELENAERLYALASRLDKADPVIPFNLGNVLDELGREREAEIAYRQAITRDPKFPDAWFNLGVLQEKLGRDDEGLASYEKAFAAEPSYADALHNAALLLVRKRRFSEALKLLDRLAVASESNPGETRRLAHLCRLELKQEQAGR